MADTDVQGMLVRIEATTAQLRREIALGENAVARASDKIDGNLADVDKAFDRTGNNAGLMQRSVTSAFTGMGLAATAAVAGLVAITTKTAEYAQEITNLAALSNTSTTDFQRLAAGAKTVGVEQGKLADIFKDTTDRAGEFITRGGGEMADFFKEIAPRVGVTAQMFANLSGPQALQLYYSSLEKAGLNQQQMTTYMEAMADEATALIPLLRNNGQGFKESGDNAEALGNILSGIQVAELVKVNQSIVELEASFAGATRQLVVGMLPGIESVTERLNTMSRSGVTEGLGAGISFLADNLNILAAIMGGKVAAAFVGYLTNLVASTAASVQSRSANIAQAASAVEVAIANRTAAQSAVERAEREAIAARGTAVQTQMSIQLAQARMAERAATAQLAIAQTALKTASTGVLALLGGPAGIAALAIGAGIAFLTMGSNAQAAAKNLDDLKGPLDQLILKFRQMTAEQRAGALVRWSEQQSAAVQKAGEEYSALETQMKNALIGPRSNAAGTALFRELTQEMAEARKTGASIIPILEKATAHGVSQKTIDSWKKQAEQFSDADVTARTAADSIKALQAEASKPVKVAGSDNSAATNAANTYLKQLEKQQHTLQDKTALEQADRYIVENKIDSEGALAAQIRERAKAIDAVKEAEKAATKSTADSAKATKQADTALDQHIKTAQTSFEALKKTYDPVGAASDQLKEKTDELGLLFQAQQISLAEYTQGLGWLQEQYDSTVQSATGMSQAMQYQAELEKQLSTSREAYDAMANSVGMGDKESERNRARIDLERETTNKILALQTELANATTEKQRSELERQIALTREYGPKQLAAMQEGWKKIDAAQATWQLGAKSAYANYQEDAANVAGQTNQLFTNAFGSMEDSLASFTTTGKLSFKSFANSVISDMARIGAKRAVSGLLGSVMSFGVKAAGSYFGGAASAGSTIAGYTGTDFSSFTPGAVQAKGGAWANGVKLFAKGGAFTNGIVSTPTAFGMSGGQAGVMGEAGPEAIMPLTRASDGSLGVRTVGGSSEPGGSTSIEIHTTIEVASNGSTTTTTDATSANAGARALADQMSAAAQAVVNKGLATGGVIRQAINGRL
jgi:lambda family phage tail tape measure protein